MLVRDKRGMKPDDGREAFELIDVETDRRIGEIELMTIGEAEKSNQWLATQCKKHSWRPCAPMGPPPAPPPPMYNPFLGVPPTP